MRINTLHNETEKFSLLNSNAYKGAFLCLVTYSHLPLFLPQQPFDAHWKMLSGFSFDIVTQLSILIQVDEVTICQLANISYVTDTKNRKQGKVFSTEQSIRLYVFIKTLDAALQLFDGDVSAALQWLKLPSKALGGESPIQMLSTPPGTEAVMDLIGRIEHGVIT